MDNVKLVLHRIAEKYPETKRIMCRMDNLRNCVDEVKKVREQQTIQVTKTISERRQWLKKMLRLSFTILRPGDPVPAASVAQHQLPARTALYVKHRRHLRQEQIQVRIRRPF